MALAGEIIRYIGNEFVPMATKTASSSLSSVIPSAITKTGASLATKAATSALGDVTNKAISNAANKSVENSVLQNIGGRIFQNGKPKSFYHGSPNTNIDKLDLSKAGSNTQSGENVLYFTDDYPTAEEFSYERLPSNSMFINNRGKKGKVYEKQLDLKNLVDLGNLSDEQIGNLYEYADAINRYDGKEKFIQRVKDDLLAGNDQSIKTRLDLNALKNSDYDGFIAKMYPNQKGLENVREYGVFNPDNVRDVRHIPINQVSNTEEVPVSTLRSLFRGQLYSDTDFSYNSPSMNSGDSAGSQALGGAYHFTPDEEKANAWADNAGGGVIKIGYKPDQLLKAEDARRMIQEAADKLNDGAYMSKLWQTDPELAEQIELVGIGNLEALAKREGKPFVEHINANDNELGTIYYYKDVDEGLTEKFREQFRKTKAEKYLGKPKVQQSEVGLSPQQQEFFKDSVVRDKNGNLMPVFHTTNTNKRIDIFNADNGMVWVTPNKMYSTGFAGNGYNPDKTYELYANIKNPVYVGNIDPAINDKTIEKLSAYTGVDEETLLAIAEKYDARNIWKITNSKDFKELMQAKGYDGIEAREGGGQVSYAAFSPEQVKRVGNLNPTNNPDIRYATGLGRGSSGFDDSIERIGSDGIPATRKETLPEGWDILEEYLGGVDKRVENAIGKAKSKITKKDLVQFLDENDYDSEGTFSELWQRAKDAVDDMTMEELNFAGSGSAADIIQMRRRPDMNNIEDVYMGNKGHTGRLDTEYSDRLGISKSTTPMSDKLSQPLEYAQGDYGSGVIGLDRTWSSGEAGVSNVAHERFHAWQEKSRGFDYPEEFKKAFEELEDEIIPLLHSKDEISKYWNGRNTDYYFDRNEQEARMVQDYLEYKNHTKRYMGGKRKYEYDERIIKPFDKFYAKLRELSKKGIAIPALAGVFGLGALANKNDDKSVDNIK